MFKKFGTFINKLGNGRQLKQQKLPKDFYQIILELELKIDSGDFDLVTVKALTKLYSQAVEYYSGKNDEKFVQFTERI